MLGVKRCSVAQFGSSVQTSVVFAGRVFKGIDGKRPNQLVISPRTPTGPKRRSLATISVVKRGSDTIVSLQKNDEAALVRVADLVNPQRLWNASVIWVNVIATLWAIWVHRNEAVFREVEVDTEMISEIYRDRVSSWNDADAHLVNQCLGNTYWVHGYPSTKRFVTIIVDASFVREDKRKPGKAAVAYVAEGTSLRCKQGSKCILADSSVQAECYAILYGVNEAAKVYKNVIVKSDCLEAIHALANPKRLRHSSILPIIHDIKKVASKLHSCACIWVRRDKVQKAHDLAALASKGTTA